MLYFYLNESLALKVYVSDFGSLHLSRVFWVASWMVSETDTQTLGISAMFRKNH